MALEGTLHDMPLADLFEVFRAGRRSGRLLVSRKGERAMIFVGGGRLLDAILITDPEGVSVAYAEDAVIRILGWPEANFVFDHDLSVNERARRIVRDMDWFLTAAAKVAIPPVSLDSLLQPSMPSSSAVDSFTLSVQEWRLMSALWPHRTLAMACVELEMSAQEVLSVAQSLVERNLLTISKNVEPSRSTQRNSKSSQPGMASAPLKHIARSQPVAPIAPVAQAQKSMLLEAIIRRVRTL